MRVKKLKIINSKNEEYDLLPEPGTEGVYCYTLSGLGLDVSATYQQVGTRYEALTYGYSQHKPKGDFIFHSTDPDKLYFDFVRFLSSRPLVIRATNFDDRAFDIDVNVSSISKDPTGSNLNVTATITFIALGLFYTSPNEVSAGSDTEETDYSRTYKYPPNDTKFENPISPPKSYTSPLSYLQGLIDETKKILSIDDDGTVLISVDSTREDVSVDDDEYVIVDIETPSTTEFSYDSDSGYVLAEVDTTNVETTLVEIYPGTETRAVLSDDSVTAMQTIEYKPSYYISDGQVVLEEVGEKYEEYQGEYSVVANSTFISFTSDSEIESGCKLTIKSYSGDVVNPHWYHYVDGVLAEEGKYNGTIPKDNSLVIDSSVVPYSIIQYNENGTKVADCYERCDFSMDRFVFIAFGNNTFSASHESSTDLNITLTPRVEYESV